MVTDSLLVMRTDMYPFSWPKSKSKLTRFLFPLCCTLTAHFSRKESQFDLYTVSIVPRIVCYIVYDIVYDITFSKAKKFLYRVQYRIRYCIRYYFILNYDLSLSVWQAVGRLDRKRGEQGINIHLLKPARFAVDPLHSIPPSMSAYVVQDESLDPGEEYLTYAYRTSHQLTDSGVRSQGKLQRIQDPTTGLGAGCSKSTCGCRAMEGPFLVKSLWIKLWNSVKRGCRNPGLVALRLFGAGVIQPGKKELPLRSE
jgi:hypothetical protein